MMLPIISVLIGISLMYYIRQKRAEKEMDEVLETCVLSCSGSLIVKFVSSTMIFTLRIKMRSL